MVIINSSMNTLYSFLFSFLCACPVRDLLNLIVSLTRVQDGWMSRITCNLQQNKLPWV